MRRRQFTQTLALLSGGAALISFTGIQAVGGSVRVGAAPKYLSREYFEAQIGEVFGIGENGSRTLRLRCLRHAANRVSNEQFHAIFEASEGVPLKEGIYQLEHDLHPGMSLFMTSANQCTSHQELVATINLLPAA